MEYVISLWVIEVSVFFGNFGKVVVEFFVGVSF